MISLPRIVMSHLLVISLVLFRSIVSEGVVANCSEPNCQDELEAAACPPDSIPDLNSPSNGCICANKCPPPPTCIPPAMSRLQRPATGEPSNCCDLYECVSPEERNCSQVICDNNEQVPCPSDSYRLPAIKSPEECCSEPQGCQCSPEPCRPLECKPPLWAKVVRPGDQKPGSCCPLYKCVEIESNETCILEDGKVYSDGATWKKSECTRCSCKNGVVSCDKNILCPPLPDECSKTIIPEGKCCPICLEAPKDHQKGCLSGTGEFIKNGDSWQEDDCTFCICQKGVPSCQAYMCEACANPRYVPHECCPLCDETSVVTLPPHCPVLSNCSLRCVHGFVRDTAGCFTCDCQQDECVLECPQGYAEDKHGNKLCECAKTTQCPPLNCKKNCLHGYRLNKAGCPQCKCDSCKPLKECSKKCPHGLMTNKNNCPVCKCLPTPSNTTINSSFTFQKGKMCTSDDIIYRDDGEMWYDGCRQCYCMAGLEMCSPLICPPTNCPTQLLNTSGCCPVCPGPQESVKRHMICGGGEGTDSFRMEGEVWNISSDIKCACQNGRTLCHAPPCPPAPCHYQSMMTSDLGCPHCSLQLLNSTFQLSTNCEGHEGVTVWRESNCISCLCDGNHAVCYTEVCSSEPCTHPLHMKGHCCPVCLDSLSKNNRIPSLDINNTPKESSHSGCIVLLNNATQLYDIGEEWRENDCVMCRCVGQGQTLCTKETCQLPSTCTDPVKTDGICCHTCLNSGAGTGGLGHETVYIVIVSVVVCTAVIVIFLVARQCRLRRQMKLPKYGCPPPQYHQYKFVPSYETPQSQSIRTTEKSALSPV